MPTFQLAVVICTLDRSEVLQDLLSDLEIQATPQTEILVVDQSTGQASSTIQARIHHLPQAFGWMHRPPGLPAARNAGLGHTTAPIVLFLDDDVRLEPGCLAAHLAAYADPRVGGVVGRIDELTVRPNATYTVNRIGRGGRVRTNLEGTRRQPIDTLKGCNMSFRRQAIERAGGFDPAYAGTSFLEDADASTRVAADGWDLWFEPKAALRHLSAPAGGVRQADAQRTEWWRFHNTGYFVRQHRGMLALPGVVLTFGGIASRRAWRWRRPGALPSLMGAMWAGWNRGDHAQR